MPEQQNIEWKQSWRDEYLQWISGFANANGGVLYLGKDNNGTIVGLNKYKKLMDELPNKIKDTTGIVCDINLHEENDKYYIEIAVESMTVPISYKGKYYKRSGSTNQLLTGTSLKDFLSKSDGKAWEEIIVPHITIDDIDIKAIEKFRKKAIATNRMPFLIDETDPVTILKNLRLIDINGNYTRAALILFGKDPRNVTMSAYLKIGKFGNSLSELILQEEVESNAFELADKTLEILNVKYFKRPISYEGLQRIETPEYPYYAVREVLFNSIIHREYKFTPITVRIYDDRLEIWNIGKLPEGLTPEKLKGKHRSVPRNNLMANVFYKGGHIEAWGRGTNKVIEECKKYDLVEPLIKEVDGGLSVTIFKDIYDEKYLSKFDLNDRQKSIIKYVKKNEYITNSIYRRLFRITEKTALRDFNELLYLGLIKKKGEKRYTKYMIDVSGYV